jgi:23S rRNA (pseudouridine1915-N3)-methyltransferase
MKLTLMVVGATDEADLLDAIDKYTARLKHYCSFGIEVVDTPKSFKKLPVNELRTGEGKLILAALNEHDVVVLLDEVGIDFTSLAFAERLQKWMNSGNKRIVFLIGGAFGFSEEVYGRANFRLSLSKMTLTHQMVRLFFTEQLYRAFTILKNEKYHH